MARIHIYDTTLRDGSQGEGVNFSLQDKLLITRRLDELGVDFIEGGYPLSNPKDFEYFQEVRKLPLRHARVAAFGMTRRKGVDAGRRHLPQGAARVAGAGHHHRRQDLGPARARGARHDAGREPAHDRRLGGLLQAGRPRGVLRRRAFLRRLAGTTRSTPCKRCGRPRRPGPRSIILCDTNGGTLPEEIADGVEQAPAALCGSSSASTATTTATWPWPTRWPPWPRGRRQVQGTINGIGERCGNVDLVSVIANLALKRGHEVLAARQPGPPDRGVALRLRDRQHELPRQPAVRRRQRLRPQGRHARARRRPQRGQLRAHRPGRGRQRAPHPGQRAVGPVDHPGQDDQVRRSTTTGR